MLLQRKEGCTLSVINFQEWRLKKQNKAYLELAKKAAAAVGGLASGGHLFIHEKDLRTSALVACGNIYIRSNNRRKPAMLSKPPRFPTWVVDEAIKCGLVVTPSGNQTVIGIPTNRETVMVINYSDYGNGRLKSLGFCTRLAEGIA
jgi:hypothetical protein